MGKTSPVSSDFDPFDLPAGATADDIADHPFHFMSLKFGPSSDQAKAIVAAVAERLRVAGGKRRKPSSEYVQALGGIVSDLLFSAGMAPPLLCAGYMSASKFKGRKVQYRPFVAAVSDLESAGFIRRLRGYGVAPGAGVLTRFIPQRKLINEFAAAGIVLADHADHFADRLDEPLIDEPIVVRAASRKKGGDKAQGRQMLLSPTCPGIARLAGEIQTLNEFLRRQRLAGVSFQGLRRIFNLGDQPGFNFNKGGRLYGSHQQLSKLERAAIRINGEPVVEIDIQACFLTILFAKRKLPRPAGDLYDVDGVPRKVVKSFITMTLGYDRYHKAWPKEVRGDFSAAWAEWKERGEPVETETGDLAKEFPIAEVQAKVLKRLPILQDWENSEIGWADLFYLESEIVLATMNELMTQGVPCLPVHDSIIVPKGANSIARKIIKERFFHTTGIEPSIK